MIEITLFNINDITVLFGGFLSLVLAALLAFRRQEGRIKKRYWMLLATFFLLSVFHSVDTLMYWNINIRTFLSSVSTDFFFLFGFVFFLQGPLLYWFTKAAIYRNFVLKPHDFLHLIPTLIYPFYVYAIYHQYDHDAKLRYVYDWTLVTSDLYFEGLVWAQRLTVFFYSVLCVYKLYRYVRHLKSTHFSLNQVDLQWLKLLLIGFLCVNAWVVLTLLESRFTNLGFDSPMGIAESYLRFIYVSALIVYLLQNSKGFAEIQVEHTIGPTPVAEEPHQQLLEKLLAYMETNKPYLEPNVTVERLALRLQVSPKLLSSTINSQLHKNFFEMIGFYRIEEAKRQLADSQYRELSISEIMKNCGFNSKSVFNQAFKKSVGVTPSHYRQQYLG
jgi:AraC-like DNA-binding protein